MKVISVDDERLLMEDTMAIEAHTFGNFDLPVDGKPIAFKQAKCKELLALSDRG